MRYRLISSETIPITLRMFPKTVGSHVSYNHYQRLEPGKEYETEDPAQIEYLKSHREKAGYSQRLENLLKESGVPYEIIRCRSCGGRVKKIEYNNVEVIEDE